MNKRICVTSNRMKVYGIHQFRDVDKDCRGIQGLRVRVRA